MLAATLDLPPRYQSPQVYEDSLGPHAIDFIESICRISLSSFGGDAGDLIALRSWQRETITDLLALDERGNLQHRTGLIGLPRANGKSMIGAALALFFLVTGGLGTRVFSVAGSKKQAHVVLDDAIQMVKASPELSEILTCTKDAITYEATNSTYVAITALADLAQGHRPSFVVFDEVHVQPNWDLWSAMVNGLSTRKSAIVLGITTAGWDRQSMCYQLYTHGKKVASGEIDDPTFFMRWWEADPDADPADPATWASANPGLGDFKSEGDLAGRFKQDLLSEFQRYQMNVWSQKYSRWLKFGAFDACALPDYKIPEGADVILGFDGSHSNDSTAIVAVERSTLHIEVWNAWEKADSQDDEWLVSVSEVEASIKAACDHFNVTEILADTYGWREIFERLSREGLPIVELPQSATRAVERIATFERLVYEKRLTHSDDPRLLRHVNNCVTKPGPGGVGHTIAKPYVGSAEKIDIAVAAVWATARAATAEPPKKKARLDVLFFDDHEDAA